ncbi:MAG TPA: hypothetical protein VGN20_03925 [Mucilaginibacter sp.]|jgi:hypothetical protein
MTDHELVKRSVYKIFIQNGYNPEGTLAQRDFEFICNEIEEHTRTLISVSTIKRLLKGDFGRIPQVATLNALATYLGFRNWQDLKTNLQQDTNGYAVSEPTVVAPRTKQVSWKWFAIAAVVLVAVAFTFLGYRMELSLGNSAPSFSARKVTGNTIPNTVVFSYDLKNVKADSFFIQQSWDKRRRVRIDKKNHVLTDIYYEPGYHTAKLIANDSVLKTVDVSIPTDAWRASTTSYFGSKLPQYIAAGKTLSSVTQSLNDGSLQKAHVTPDEHTLFVCSYFPSVLIGDGDDFTCNMRVRLTDARSKQCPCLMFEVCCQRQFMYFMSMNKGCASETEADFGDRKLNGKTTDMSPLCFDLQQWTDINWEVKNKKVAISINGQKVFETAYNKSCGKITGVGVVSNGFYEMSRLELTGHDGKRISENGFVGSAEK